MDLLMSCFITPKRASIMQNGVNDRCDRIDVFKWTLASYSKMPINHAYLFIELDEAYANRRAEIAAYATELFGDRLSFEPRRLLHKRDWAPVISKIGEYANSDYPVWFAQSDDHIFIDFDLDILKEGIELLKKDASPYRSLLYSHWPEGLRMSGTRGSWERTGNYIRHKRPLFENMCIYNFGVLNYVFTEYTWSVDPPTYGWVDCLRCDFSVTMYVPLRELCRHFDGYSHVKMRIDKDAEFPAMVLPPDANNFKFTESHLRWRFHVPHWGNDPMALFTIPREWEDAMVELYRPITQ